MGRNSICLSIHPFAHPSFGWSTRTLCKGPEGLLVGPEGLPEGSKGLPEGYEGLTEGSKGFPDGLGAF